MLILLSNNANIIIIMIRKQIKRTKHTLDLTDLDTVDSINPYLAQILT
jgi:hypothetical protein